MYFLVRNVHTGIERKSPNSEMGSKLFVPTAIKFHNESIRVLIELTKI